MLLLRLPGEIWLPPTISPISSVPTSCIAFLAAKQRMTLRDRCCAQSDRYWQSYASFPFSWLVLRLDILGYTFQGKTTFPSFNFQYFSHYSCCHRIHCHKYTAMHNFFFSLTIVHRRSVALDSKNTQNAQWNVRVWCIRRKHKKLFHDLKFLSFISKRKGGWKRRDPWILRGGKAMRDW